MNEIMILPKLDAHIQFANTLHGRRLRVLKLQFLIIKEISNDWESLHI